MSQRVLLAIGCSLLLGACSAQGATTAPVMPPSVTPPLSTNELEPLSTVQAQLIYVTNLDGATNGGAIRAYTLTANGNVAPQLVIAGSVTGLTNPTGIAITPAGRLGVANVRNANGGVAAEVFAPGAHGNVAPLHAISCGATTIPLGAAFDAAGNLYITSGDDGEDIAVFAPSANGCVSGNRVIAGPHTTLKQPFGIAVDGTGAIYTANASGASVVTFAPGASGDAAPRALLAGTKTGIGTPSGVALDGALHLYVTDFRANSILEFSPGANGNVSPVRKIAGPRTGLNGPSGIKVDRAGNIYVVNVFGNTIAVYSASARGDAAPIRLIAGSNTGLSSPHDLAVSQ